MRHPVTADDATASASPAALKFVMISDLPCRRRGQRRVFVRKRRKALFDPKKFLAKVGEGKTITNYRKDQIVFSQGDAADAVFYIQQGTIKLTVISEQGKEAVIAMLEPGQFFGEGCLN